MDIPDWLRDALIATIAAMGGFFGKEAWDVFKRRRRAHADSLSALHHFKHLLEDSKSVFRSQNYLARRLMSRLKQRLGDEIEPGLGFDETFHRWYDRMDEEERELQALIRSTTLNSMHSLNLSLREWARQHREMRSRSSASIQHSNLAEDLRELELHLNQWFDKYDAFIPDDEKRSLVYLADEKRQGNRFPQRLETSLQELIEEIS